MRYLKHVVLWVLLSVPIGIGAGALVSAIYGEGAEIDRFTAAVNGGLAGLWIAIVGGIAAATTNAIARHRLAAAGGSEFITGMVVSFGLIAAALGLLLLG